MYQLSRLKKRVVGSVARMSTELIMKSLMIIKVQFLEKILRIIGSVVDLL